MCSASQPSSRAMVEAMRSRIGVKSRSGIASWNLDGETIDGNRPVDVKFSHGGPVDIYHRKPVEKDVEGKSISIIAPPEQSERLLKEIKENLAEKGVQISNVETRQTPTQEILVSMTVNMTIMRSGLMKIAYLACCDFLGDGFLDDPLNPEWQKAIRAQSADEADQVKIRTWYLQTAPDYANDLLPSLVEQEHGIVIANLNKHGVFVGVTLFGCKLLTIVAQASATSSHGLSASQGLQLICDSKSGTIRRKQIVVEGAES
jgi:hypothetical protein